MFGPLVFECRTCKARYPYSTTPHVCPPNTEPKRLLPKTQTATFLLDEETGRLHGPVLT